MSPEYIFTDSQAKEWRESTIADGVQVKDLGIVDGQAMQLVRFAPGTKFPSHLHEGPVFVFMLEGEAFQNEQRLGPGWASAAESGTFDENFHSPNGCTFVTVYPAD